MSYNVQFFGNFRLLAPDDEDLTPSSSRHRALLALIASSEDLRRSRRWLEDHLWSTRGSKQASGSFREALRVLRKDLGRHSEILIANRSEVWLDSTMVTTDLDPKSSGRTANRQFLEGLDVPDPQFDEWLRDMRAQYDHKIAPQQDSVEPLPHLVKPAAGILVRSRVGRIDTRAEGMAAQLIADYIATNFEDWFGSWLQSNQLAPNDSSADLEVSCDMAQDGGVCVVHVTVGHIASGRILYSGYRKFRGAPLEALDQELFAGLIHAAASKVSANLPAFIGVDRPESVAAGFAHFGKQRLLRFDPESMEEAYGFMSQARQAHEHGVFVAWQAFIRMAQLVDSFCDDREGKTEDLKDLSAQALELSGDNALSIALVAIARNMGQIDSAGCAALAERAMKLNPMNLFARQAMALVHSNAGDIQSAYLLSKSCQNLLPEDESRHLWDLYHALVCIAAGKNPEALISAERASVRCTEFIAPRRQLLGLYLNENRIEDAKIQFDLLNKKESGFSLDRFLNDPAYPVDTLRKRGLVHQDLEGIFS